MPYEFHTLDVFSNEPFGGNPLAVVSHAEGLRQDQMQEIAAEFGHSETAFLFPPERPASCRRIRIFTPRVELPFAGHPTVGTALLLSMLCDLEIGAEGLDMILEEEVGDVRVHLRRPPGSPGAIASFLVPGAPEFRPPAHSSEELAEVVSLGGDQILSGSWIPQLVSWGVPFLLLPVSDLRALRCARVNAALWRERIAGSWAPHIYVFTPNTGSGHVNVRARMFGPALGVVEDPATGAAAAALAAYVAARDLADPTAPRWIIEQGVEMGRPSRIVVNVEGARDGRARIRIGGSAVLVTSGMLRL